MFDDLLSGRLIGRSRTHEIVFGWALISLVEMRVGASLHKEIIRIMRVNWRWFVVLLVTERVPALLHIIYLRILVRLLVFQAIV